MLEAIQVMIGMGKILLPEPLISSMIAASILSEQKARKVITGKEICLLAWQEEAGSLPNAMIPKTRFENGRLSGVKRFVSDASVAQSFLVTTDKGIALVPFASSHVRIQSALTQDGGNFGTIEFDHALSELLPDVTEQNINCALERATLLTAAYLHGMLVQSFEITLDYLKTRRQFNAPIASFQAIQHRMADLKIQVMLSEACIHRAAQELDSQASIEDIQRTVSRAKTRSSEAALLIGRQSIQLHGAIGYTDECDIGLYLRKVMTYMNMFGSAEAYRHRFQQLYADF